MLNTVVTLITRRPAVVGISSLGLDHTSLLGSTIEDIAWQKGGIMKPGTLAFTSPQPPSAATVLHQRAVERKVCKTSNISCNVAVISQTGLVTIGSMCFNVFNVLKCVFIGRNQHTTAFLKEST